MIDETWADAAIESCLQLGIDHFFLAPGSRCTPLTLAVARRRDVVVTQHFDERGLAFAALGFGRAKGRPGVFICTSGTAVANAYPAVIEASTESIPLLLFTADRPDELQGSGANQTIDQQEIFGSYPQLFVNVPAPDESHQENELCGSEFVADQVVRAVTASQLGPVHLNWMFREPFTMSDRRQEACEADVNADSSFAANGLIGHSESEPKPVERVALQGQAIIALGGCRPEEADQALALSKQLRCPLLSDVTSGLKAGSFDVLQDSALPLPDTILHIGGRIVSKSWLNWTYDLRDTKVEYVHLTSTGQTINPHGLPIKKLETSLQALDFIDAETTSHDFTSQWQEVCAARDNAIIDFFTRDERLSEPALAFHVSRMCPADTGLMLGNSTPIRDMDWFGQGEYERARLVVANRGASGIDGLLATATGYARGLRACTTIVLGDLSALHDLNSMSLVAHSPWPMIVIIINNQAGHIFDLLPISKSPHFEQFFATPHDYRFEGAAKMFDINYRQITSLDRFRNEYREALQQDRSVVLEVMTDRTLNQEVRHQVRDEIRKSRP